jgi:hypothetical protein
MYCDLLINDVIKLLFLNFASVIVHVYLLLIRQYKGGRGYLPKTYVRLLTHPNHKHGYY